MQTRKRMRVRGECPQCAGGRIGHMTVYELLERTFHDNCNLACPVCGLIHLSREEIDRLEEQKIIYSERYQQIRQQAEAMNYT